MGHFGDPEITRQPGGTLNADPDDSPPIEAYLDEPAARGAVAKLKPVPSSTSDHLIGPSPERTKLIAEESVIGGMLIGGDWGAIKSIVRAQDYTGPHRLIISAIASLSDQGEPSDPPSVALQLTRTGHLDAVGGLARLIRLANDTPSAAAVASYARAVRDLAAPVKSDSRTPIDWMSLADRAPPARTWWLQDWLGPTPTLCSGPGGVGKSLLWQTIGTSLACGVEFLGPAAQNLRILVWACEDDSDEIWRRQADICRHFGLAFADLGRLNVVPRHGADNTLLELSFGKPVFTPVFAQLREQVNDLGVDVLVLDNIGQVYGGGESDRHQVTKFVNGVHGMVTGRPFASVFVGHVARAQGSEYSGSAAWENACRMRWYLGPTLPDQPADTDEPVNTDVVYLAKRKANYSAKDYRRLHFQNGLLVPEVCVGRRFDQGSRNEMAEEVVLRALAKLIAAGIQPSDAPNSRDYLPRQVAAKNLLEGYTKKEIETAMNRLMGVGKLRRDVVGKYSNRSLRYGLVVAP